jgi:AraC-like DNA-binding protein
MSMSGLLNERAAKQRPRREALWHVDRGWAVFAGPLDHNAPHAHSTAVYLAGLYGRFRLRVAGSDWTWCRSAVIRAGTSYEFDMGGDPLGVLYLEPDTAGAEALAALVRNGRELSGALVGSADVSPLREHFEQRAVGGELCASMLDVVNFARERARRRLDERVMRAVAAIEANADDNASVTEAASAAGLSHSRFQHLFTREVGVPFRRYRGWQRLRTAIRAAAAGSNLTTAAHMAGFSDQAHFTRAFRRAFGAPPSHGL